MTAIPEPGKDYIVQLRIKNGPMLRAMRAKGIFTAAELMRRLGITRSPEIYNLLNLRISPIGKRGNPLKIVLRIAEILDVEPLSLFPPQHIDTALLTNTAEIEADLTDLVNLDNLIEHATPETALIEGDLGKAIGAQLATLTEREQDIVESRYGLNGDPATLAELGIRHGISGPRVREIEAKALRKIRHPSRAKHLEGYW